jgi:hypothetical protein
VNGEVLPLRKANCMSGHGFTLGIVFGGRLTQQAKADVLDLQ